MFFSETVHIAKTKIDRVNALLSADFSKEHTDEELLRMGAKGFFPEGIFRVTFTDGSIVNFDLCADSYDTIEIDFETQRKIHYFFDQVIWTSADGTRDVELNCAYELADIEVEIDGNTYEVRIMEV